MNALITTLVPYFCILSLAAIAIIFTERSGIINLGINGTMVFGATTYMIFAHIIAPVSGPEMSGWLNIPLFIFGALGGILFSSLHGLISIKLKGNQTISGIALNILAPAFTLVILYLFGEANAMPYNVKRLELGNSANNELISIVSLKVVLTVVISITSFIALTFTKWGLRFKAVGENPQAADSSGINVNRMKWKAIIISGAIAGIAGSIYITEFSTGSAFKSQVTAEGLGFLAIAIVIISQWKVLLVNLISIIFGLLFALGQQANNIFANGSEIQPILMMLPYLFTILVLIIFSEKILVGLSYLFQRWADKLGYYDEDQQSKSATVMMNWSKKLMFMSKNKTGPKALGQPYDKSKR